MKQNQSAKIKRFREIRRKRKENYSNLIAIRPSKKTNQALSLPKVLNINPRSIYNVIAEFVTFIEEEMVDLICISESWEREDQTLDKVIKIDNYKVISNVHQRTGIGGRPAIIVNTQKYEVEDLTNTSISIPWGVEIVWAVLTPKSATITSEIQKIVVASMYCKPKSRKKTLMLDHIAQTFNFLSAKYKRGLHWLLCGDTNDLRLDQILALSSNFKQCVQHFTRLNPPRILDPIITSLSKYYQIPDVLSPLDPDPDKNGKPSDHMMVLFTPITSVNNKCVRKTREIKFRPLNENGINKMNDWLKTENWEQVFNEPCANMKAQFLQNTLVSKVNEYFPEKTRIISCNDQPFFSYKLKNLKRKKAREYQKHRKSIKYKKLEELYQQELSKSKSSFYRKQISRLRKSKPGKWYSELKKLTNFDQFKTEKLSVEKIKHLPDFDQAELIADKFSEVANEYEELKTEDINVPPFCEDEIPQFSEEEIYKALSEIDTNKSNVNGDIPAKLLKLFSKQLASPIKDCLNRAIKQGRWPDIFKMEIVTPIPKQIPPQDINHLRNISGLLNLDKIGEKLISKLIISDMKGKLDPSQYANQEGLSIQHYLVKFIDRILQALDKKSNSETCAVLATLVDWQQAFPRQCPKLGVESFIRNGVRPSLIPVIMNYFQGRKMRVKWHGQLSSERKLKGGGPQGSSFGLWEYISQSNDNADCIEEEDRFKFVDDLSFLEIIYLLSVGISSYNIKAHVSSDLPTHNQIIPNSNLKSQDQLEKINKWTEERKMKLNVKKTKTMIFNFSKNSQFTTKLNVLNTDIDMVKEATLLGTVITDQLNWDRNTEELTKKGYKRMQLLNCVSTFTKNRADLKNIYLTFIRSVVEQSAVVWHSSLTKRNRKDLERIQKVAVRIIMGKSYTNYKEGLKELKLDTLEKRRTILSLRFAKKCLKNEKLKTLFPLNKSKHNMKKRNKRKYQTRKIKTKRLENSAIPYMTKLLNIEESKKQKIIENLSTNCTSEL